MPLHFRSIEVQTQHQKSPEKILRIKALTMKEWYEPSVHYSLETSLKVVLLVKTVASITNEERKSTDLKIIYNTD